MLDAATTALLRAILDEVCESVSRDETGARAHVASKILETSIKGETAPDRLRQIGREALNEARLCGVGRRHDDVVTQVNFQLTVLKILVSYPDGFAPMAELKRDMAILATSGRDWAEHTRRLAARVPNLDIFSQKLVSE